MIRLPPRSTLFPYTTLFRSRPRCAGSLIINDTAFSEIYTLSIHDAFPISGQLGCMIALAGYPLGLDFLCLDPSRQAPAGQTQEVDRKSTRLNSSHSQISYAVFCLKKKKLVAV